MGEDTGAYWSLRENAEALKNYMDSFYEAKREQHDGAFGRPYGVEERCADLLTLVGRLSVSIYQGLQVAASAIEARSDATGTGAAEGESAVGNAETPKPHPSTPSSEER